MIGLGDFLGKSIGLPCDALDPFERLTLSAKKADADYLHAHKGEFVVAVGNALHIAFD